VPRIYLSPPHLSGYELSFVKDVFDSNWIAPIGPHVDLFESEVAEFVGVSHAAALSSGTAALHLALRLLNLRPHQEVWCPTLTFAAAANVIVYEGCIPVFIDCDAHTWNMDAALLKGELERAAKSGQLPGAVITVDLYGQCADYNLILEACDAFGVPIIEDAAEALGATYGERKAGSLGRLSVISFNGNKIITTSGGGMLLSDDGDAIRRARFLATQAKDIAPHYQHSEIGFNYRMSNVLAAIGRAQLKVLPERVIARQRNFEFYRKSIGDLPGVTLMPEAPYGKSSKWLTCVTIDPVVFGATREAVRTALDAQEIEARPIWKPLHLQPVFKECRVVGGNVANGIFEQGLCLPSGSALKNDELQRISAIIRAIHLQSSSI